MSVVNKILNRQGHSVSYQTMEEVEIQLATDISNKDQNTADGILTLPDLCTGLEWDNYDERNETPSGADTLHDTVEICYQKSLFSLVCLFRRQVTQNHLYCLDLDLDQEKDSFNTQNKNLNHVRKKTQMQ